MKRPGAPIATPSLIASAIKNALYKLNPRIQYRNPVMFVTYVGAGLTSLSLIINGGSLFDYQITLWLWFTVLFANLAEALAEGRGKAHAQSLKSTQAEVTATQLKNGLEVPIAANKLRSGDVVICKAGDIIPADGEAIEGIATVDESAITGESAPVIRESGGDRSAVTCGTSILSDQLIIRVTAEPGKSFLDRMIAMIEGAKRQKTPNEIALSIVLSALTIIFLITVVSLYAFADYSGKAAHEDLSDVISVPILTALLVCLIPTTISGLMSAVGIAGMDRLLRQNVVAKSGRAVEAAGDIDLLLLDKTGTITLGNRVATEFIPAAGFSDKDLASRSQLASLADETPEGRSIVVLAKSRYNLRGVDIQKGKYQFHPFSAQSRMSGVDILDGDNHISRSIRKGAVDAVRSHIEGLGGTFPADIKDAIDRVSRQGSTPLLVSEGRRIIGLIHLKDVVKGGIKERFSELRKMGIRTVMVTGDNPLTAAAIAAEAGVDDFIAQATPEDKYLRIKQEQQEGRLVAMTGDGTNDAPALALADVAVAMNTGTQATREAGNMVDLDSNPTKLIEIVKIGKQLLMTRGALTTFSMANDVAKYFAIIPAMFGTLYASKGMTYGPLSSLNIMELHSAHSAILSAVIFNALIIVLLIPLAIRGVHYRSESAQSLLLRNVLIYGLGGLILPFIGIKLIDLAIVSAGLVY